MPMSATAPAMTTSDQARWARSRREMTGGGLAAGLPRRRGGRGGLGLSPRDAAVLVVEVRETHRAASRRDGTQRQRLEVEGEGDEAAAGKVEEHERDDHQHHRQ